MERGSEKKYRIFFYLSVAKSLGATYVDKRVEERKGGGGVRVGESPIGGQPSRKNAGTHKSTTLPTS